MVVEGCPEFFEDIGHRGRSPMASKDDLVSGKDGKNASEFTLRELRDSLSRAGEHHAFEVQRSGEWSTKNLDVRLVSIER